jgi:hypothetical protein
MMTMLNIMQVIAVMMMMMMMMILPDHVEGVLDPEAVDPLQPQVRLGRAGVRSDLLRRRHDRALPRLP